MRQYDLYLGRNVPGKPLHSVSDDELDTFLRSINRTLPSYTLIHAIGTWRGEQENCVILRVIGNDSDEEAVRRVAGWYKHQFKQEAVLLTITKIQSEVI